MTGVLQVLMGTGGSSSGSVDFTYHLLNALTDVGGTGSYAQVGYRLNTVGEARRVGVQNFYDNFDDLIEQGITPSSATANYEVYASLGAGATPFGSLLNTWVPLTVTQLWSIDQSGIGINSCTIDFQIRLASGGAVIDTWSIDLVATVSV
jgi:hypothetical protein